MTTHLIFIHPTPMGSLIYSASLPEDLHLEDALAYACLHHQPITISGQDCYVDSYGTFGPLDVPDRYFRLRGERLNEAQAAEIRRALDS